MNFQGVSFFLAFTNQVVVQLACHNQILCSKWKGVEAEAFQNQGPYYLVTVTLKATHVATWVIFNQPSRVQINKFPPSNSLIPPKIDMEPENCSFQKAFAFPDVLQVPS